MQRRRFYAPPKALEGKAVVLGPDESHHLIRVLRMKPGDEAFVFDGEQREYRCRVSQFDGPLARLRDGDVVRLCGHDGTLEALNVGLTAREPIAPPSPPIGTGRELFAFMRATANDAERGASAMLHAMEPLA